MEPLVHLLFRCIYVFWLNSVVFEMLFEMIINYPLGF
jgi:hypothetical protein